MHGKSLASYPLFKTNAYGCIRLWSSSPFEEELRKLAAFNSSSPQRCNIDIGWYINQPIQSLSNNLIETCCPTPPSPKSKHLCWILRTYWEVALFTAGLRQWGKSHDLWTCLDPQNSDQASRVLNQRPFCNRLRMTLLLAWRELNMNKSSRCLNPKHSEHLISHALSLEV